ncbi:MAG: 2-succinyl-5-enolpyruvyl-6-hydroxy-3-cyclohexene-1-carboxylic-acid synthase [candidate division Zixibacteria bacterium]|nr:2-succinyl-5-enolpyruvyl-6-hydroxy-3-cyclohexene-1-carboxylic-acid synthase [candidate division Zixibacteria bacterium]
MTAPNINYFVAQMIIDRLCALGLRQMAISPGSRSAPLAVAASTHPALASRMIIDERTAAYYALGTAQATGSPAGVICTSGTAVANLFPAVVEAYQSRLPLVLLTADRPEELQNRGANQTIDQQGIFGRYATSVTIAAPDRSTDPVTILEQLNRAMMNVPDGPVHINMRFREPLAPVEEPYDREAMSKAVAAWLNTHDHETAPLSVDDLARLADDIIPLIRRSRSGLIVAGPEAPFRAGDGIGSLAERLGWPMAGDILSQQRGRRGGNRCTAYDLYLDAPEFGEQTPCDLLLHFGGLPTSKRLNEFLVRLKGIPYIKIQDHGRTIDPERLETGRIVAPVGRFLAAVGDQIESRGEGEHLLSWRHREKQAAEALAGYFADDRLTEPAVAYHLGRWLDEGEAVFLSNSLPVREAESFMDFEGREIMVGCNRGASGIDGVLASACGFAAGSGRSTTLLIGDLALLHDLNSLVIAAESAPPVTIVVLNNGGGGIFDFLPIARFPELLERCFTAGHRLTFDSAARMVGLPYHRPASTAELAAAYRSARETGQSSLIEISLDHSDTVGEQERIRTRVHTAMKG